MIATGLAALPITAVIATASSADAAFSGSNGPVAFVSTRANSGSFGGIFQVNSQASGLGTAGGDQAATSGLTNAGGSGVGVKISNIAQSPAASRLLEKNTVPPLGE